MSHWAKPGVKCVCVDNDEHPELVVGRDYTIISSRAPWVLAQGKYGNKSRFLIEVSGVRNWDGSVFFAVERFRPLITKTQEQDVALFRHILDGLPIGENA